MNILSLMCVYRQSFIRNADLPVCKKCIHYKVNTLNHYKESNPDQSGIRCLKFGRKDIISGDVIYDYVDFCRSDSSKCGMNGTHYQENKMTVPF